MKIIKVIGKTTVLSFCMLLNYMTFGQIQGEEGKSKLDLNLLYSNVLYLDQQEVITLNQFPLPGIQLEAQNNKGIVASLSWQPVSNYFYSTPDFLLSNRGIRSGDKRNLDFHLVSAMAGKSFTDHRFIWTPKGGVSYRTGRETLVMSVNAFDLIVDHITYNSIGLAAGCDVDFFLTERLTLGAGFYLHRQFEQNNLDDYVLQVFKEHYNLEIRPNKAFLNNNFRLAYTLFRNDS